MELKAGRELDVLVAEKVMDLSVKWWPHGPEIKYRDGTPVPAYSTEISAAWEVVEKLKWAEPLVHWDRAAGSWACEFVANGVEASADTAPLAICLAALKALG